MSASTRTIQQPVGQGAILGAIAAGVAIFLAVGALAWGALNLTATNQSAAHAVSPAFADEGRTNRQVAAPAPAPIFVDRDLRNVPAIKAVAPKTSSAVTPFDIDSAHAKPYVDRFPTAAPETPFDKAHAPAYVAPAGK